MAATPEPDWTCFGTPAGSRYRDLLIERAGVRASRVWGPDAEPMWSPEPIVGYRMWHVTARGVVGATRHVWGRPTLRAECSRTGTPGSPHLRAQGLCPGLCGINAFADPARLVEAGPARVWALRSGGIGDAGLYGAVSLSGRVVEHDDGYRGELARVVGLVWPVGTTVWSTIDPAAIERMFRDPGDPSWAGWRPVYHVGQEAIAGTVVQQLRRITHAPRT